MHRECRERFPRHRGLVIPTCITARVWRTWRDACRDRYLAVSFEVGGGEKRSRHSRRMRNPQFTYLVRGPWPAASRASHGYWTEFYPASLSRGEVSLGRELWCMGSVPIVMETKLWRQHSSEICNGVVMFSLEDQSWRLIWVPIPNFKR